MVQIIKFFIVSTHVDGYSKVGSYTGNGSADGTFVHCGFRPAYVMVKDSTTGWNWWVYDNARDTYNQTIKGLRPILVEPNMQMQLTQQLIF